VQEKETITVKAVGQLPEGPKGRNEIESDHGGMKWKWRTKREQKEKEEMEEKWSRDLLASLHI